jgi:hypothetical protein
MARRKSRRVLEAEQFHAIVVKLLFVSDAEWSEWEERWLLSEARRPISYIYSKDERKILNQLIAVARSFAQYSECSVLQLINLADQFRADYQSDDDQFVKELKRNNVASLRLRQIMRLADLVRINDDLRLDQDIEEVANQTRRRDDSVYEPDEFTAYPNMA